MSDPAPHSRVVRDTRVSAMRYTMTWDWEVEEGLDIVVARTLFNACADEGVVMRFEWWQSVEGGTPVIVICKSTVTIKIVRFAISTSMTSDALGVPPEANRSESRPVSFLKHNETAS